MLTIHRAMPVHTDPFPVPDLPPFDPAKALTLVAVCKLGLVPGVEGRRLTSEELVEWATAGHQVVEGGPSYLFPTVLEGDTLLTTSEWCAAWVTFVAEIWEAGWVED